MQSMACTVCACCSQGVRHVDVCFPPFPAPRDVGRCCFLRRLGRLATGGGAAAVGCDGVASGAAAVHRLVFAGLCAAGCVDGGALACAAAGDRGGGWGGFGGGCGVGWAVGGWGGGGVWLGGG